MLNEASYISYFALAFFALRWWRMADRRRPQRFSFAPVLAAGFWGLVLLLLVRPLQLVVRRRRAGAGRGRGAAGQPVGAAAPAAAPADAPAIRLTAAEERCVMRSSLWIASVPLALLAAAALPPAAHADDPPTPPRSSPATCCVDSDPGHGETEEAAHEEAQEKGVQLVSELSRLPIRRHRLEAGAGRTGPRRRGAP